LLNSEPSFIDRIAPKGERAVETRMRIIDAGIAEFSAQGLAGARTEQIAKSAGVNKALLYYYFKSKEELYEIAIKESANRVVANSHALMSAEYSAGEKLLRTTLMHFDRHFTQREFQSLLQQEMIRAHRGEPNLVSMLAEEIFRPLILRMRDCIDEGIQSGELIDVEWTQMHYVAVGANAFYFISAPMMSHVLGVDLFKPEVLIERRRAVVEFLGQAIFTNREEGKRIAEKVLASVPLPMELSSHKHSTNSLKKQELE
jgi:TetR/AcrR family transcriptional regulator